MKKKSSLLIKHGFSFIFLLLILQKIFSETANCEGNINTDILFLIDDSSSVNDEDWIIFMESCINMVNEFGKMSPDNSIGVERFGKKIIGGENSGIEFTRTKEVVLNYFSNLLDGCYEGECQNRWKGTIGMAEGLQNGYNELVSRGRTDAMTIIYLFVDRNVSTTQNCCISEYCTYESTACMEEITQISGYYDTFNSWIVPILLGDNNNSTYLKPILQNISTYDCLYFEISEYQTDLFEELTRALTSIVCIDVFSIEPSYVCPSNEVHNITVNGNGFIQEFSKGDWCIDCQDRCSELNIKCKIKELGTGVEKIFNATNIQFDALTCPVDLSSFGEEQFQQIQVSVSLDGSSFTSISRTFETVNCTTEELLDPGSISYHCFPTFLLRSMISSSILLLLLSFFS